MKDLRKRDIVVRSDLGYPIFYKVTKVNKNSVLAQRMVNIERQLADGKTQIIPAVELPEVEKIKYDKITKFNSQIVYVKGEPVPRPVIRMA